LIVGEYTDVKDATPACAVGTVTAAALNSVSESSPEDLVEQLPLKTRTKRKNIIDRAEVGYHMLNRDATEKSGVPQYIYVGDTPLKKPGYYMLNTSATNQSKPKYDYVGNKDESSSEEE